MSDVTTVTNHFSTANEGFSTRTLSTVVGGTTATVDLVDMGTLVNNTVFVGIIEPGTSFEQVFTGTVDLPNSCITGVKWTRGTNRTHAGNSVVVDYVTGTDHNMMTKGLLVEHTQAGRHVMTSPKVITSINDTNNNEVIRISPTANAVNDVTVFNATSTNYPTIQASGDDNGIDLNFATKGANSFFRFNGTSWRPDNNPWSKIVFGAEYTSAPTGTFTDQTGSGWAFPGWWVESTNLINSQLDFKIYMDSGTYNIVFLSRTGSDKGIITFSITNITGNTSVISTADCYAASGSTQVVSTTTGLAFTGGGLYTFSFKTATKNASSSGYILPLFTIKITRTA